MLAVIDNYDSFTYNIVQYLRELGSEVVVFRNDQITLAELSKKNLSGLLISPGPGTPDRAGISLKAVEHFANQLPVFGVCLGHQCMGQLLGGKIVHASAIMHGKLSDVHHKGSGVFKNLPSPFVATRYHSLVIDKKSLPESLEVTAWTQTETGEVDEIMGIRHTVTGMQGVQFHPESISSEHGHQLFRNFLDTLEANT
ncbi:MAG: aminodeoxychorismate/anthranilate synthase component II [Gammaproteobacteria bacterium]|nr:aminodeoxychorismate/anthranilate synthase component II [Gammaproteobacteria bacterium]